MESENKDLQWMQEAYKEAQKAGEMGEVPIGAVIVYEDQIIARAHNLREINRQAIAHAEILAIQKANEYLGAWRLEGGTLYVTLEPCPMCAGAIIMSRLDRVVFACHDPKGGCCGSLMNLLDEQRFNHRPQFGSGVMEEECSLLMKDFFRKLRAKKASSV